MGAPNIVVLGAVFVDLIFKGVPRLPGSDESVYASNYQFLVGGKGFNQARAAAALGANVSLLTCVGDDSHGQTVVQEMSKCNLDTSATQIVSNAATPVCCVVVDEQRNTSFVGYQRECHVAMTQQYIDSQRKAIENADLLVTTFDYPLPIVSSVLNIARQANVFSIANPAPLPEPVSADTIEVLKLADLTVPNLREARLILEASGSAVQNDPDILASKLVSRGIARACVTHGERGSVLHDKQNRPIVQPAFRVATDNAVGASDQLCGAFAHYWTRHSPAETLRLATAFVSLWLSRQSRIQPTEKEVIEYLEVTAGGSH